MALPSSVSAEAWAKLPDVLKAEYSEQDGAYVLQVTKGVGGFLLEDAGKLHKTLEKERKAVGELKTQLAAFGDLTPEAAQEAAKKVGEMSSWTPEQKVQEKIDAHVKQVTEKYTKELGTRDAQINEVTGQLKEQLLTNAATAALVKHKAKNVKVLLPIVLAAMEMQKGETGKLVARMIDDSKTPLISRKKGSDAYMDVDEYVEGMRGETDYGPFFEATVTKGPRSTKSEPGGAESARTVSKDDQGAMDDNIDAIATGKVVVV